MLALVAVCGLATGAARDIVMLFQDSLRHPKQSLLDSDTEVLHYTGRREVGIASCLVFSSTLHNLFFAVSISFVGMSWLIDIYCSHLSVCVPAMEKDWLTLYLETVRSKTEETVEKVVGLVHRTKGVPNALRAASRIFDIPLVPATFVSQQSPDFSFVVA
jgi:hypothetical protein